MLRSGKTKGAKEKNYDAKNPINIWNVDINNIIISTLIEMYDNSKYLIGYLHEVIKY